MKKIALLTLLLINLSLSFSLPRNQASPAIFSVTKTNNSILFRHTDSTLTAIPCQSVASIVSNADPSKIVSVWVVQQGDYDKIMQFDYSVCGFSSKSDAVDSLTAWAICDTSSGGGGGASLSSLTAASSINNIFNANYKQRWNWNTLEGDTAFLLTSNSLSAASNLQTLFALSKSGANANANQTSYVQKISHTGSGANNVNIGLKINVSGGTGIKSAALVLNASGGTAPRSIIVESGGGAAELNGENLYFSSNKYIMANVQKLAYDAADRPHNFSTSCPTPVIIGTDINGSKPFSINHASANNYELVFGGDVASGYRSDETSNNTIKATGGTLSFSAQTGLAGGFAAFTPNYIMHIYGTNQNVGIGTATPVASALLDLNSTTKGTLITRMTGLQAEAISSPATMLLVAITNGNGSVITSTGFWYYDGSTWIKL